MFQKKLLGVSLIFTALLIVLTGTAVLAQDPPPPLEASASFEAPAPPGCGLSVDFMGSASGGTTPYSFLWAFGDGETSTLEDPMHTYAAAGTYNVILTVTDSSDPVQSVGSSLVVEVFEPVDADASADPTDVILDEVTGTADVDFTGEVSGGVGPYSFAWDFDGDGTTDSTDQNPTHTYDEVGVFEVAFMAEDANGCVGEDSLTVVVSSEEAESVVGDMLADFFEATNDEINALREMDLGWGGIAHAYWLAKLTGEDVETIVDMRNDMGWGQIFAELLPFHGLGGFNLGAIMSGRFEAMLEECGLDQEQLVAFVQDFEVGLPTIRHACRLAAQAGDEATLEDILAMHQEGMNWGQIRKELGMNGQGQGEDEDAVEEDSDDEASEEEVSATSERGNHKKDRRGDELSSDEDEEESTTTVERGRGKSKKSLRGTRDRGPRSNRGRGRR